MNKEQRIKEHRRSLIDFIVWYKANRHLYNNSNDHEFMVDTFLKSIKNRLEF